MFGRITDRMIVMSRYANDAVTYAPLYIHSFRLIAAQKLVDAEKFNIRYTSPDQIDNTPDKLRWYRYQKGLLQKEVAAAIGVDRSTYCGYEEGEHDYYPISMMDKLAELFDVSIISLLDEYNLFLYYGQGTQIKMMREMRQMTVREYAQHLGIYAANLKRWENDEVRITKKSWAKLREIG